MPDTSVNAATFTTPHIQHRERCLNEMALAACTPEHFLAQFDNGFYSHNLLQ
ncbi:hypothetical protein [Aeromonas cavernicola]|uniref:hypothetical protein n=1 Tax=Aeromonas cavernicola TaxID=1006623 RepID=UPI00142DB895|nr:hypothetical protein [Aeromonas cavernicola]